MNCKNNRCINILSKKQKNFCSRACQYEWKKNQPNGKMSNNTKKNNLKNYASSLKDKKEIYDFISSNIFKFNTNSNLKESQRISKMIKEYNIFIEGNGDFQSWKDLYDYLLKISICINKECNNESIFGSFTSGYKSFCSKECLHRWRSDNMSGENNNFHKVPECVRKRIGSENSARIKEKIKNGTFTPNITNSWAKSRCLVNINNNILKFRSSWEAYFQIINPYLKYEKLRIPYFYNKEWHNYIVDFIDENQRIIYEIKPISESNNLKNRLKKEAAIRWAHDNQYEYIEINESWFIDNYKESLILGQPDEEKLKRLLSQFK
jgi:hypothetical protein